MTMIHLQISGTFAPESVGHIVVYFRTNLREDQPESMGFDPLSTQQVYSSAMVLRLNGGGASTYWSSEVEGPELSGNIRQPSRDALERGRMAAQSVDPETLARMTAPQIQRLFAEHGAAGLDAATAERILQQVRHQNLESQKMEDDEAEGSERGEGSSNTRRHRRADDDIERDPWSGEVSATDYSCTPTNAFRFPFICHDMPIFPKGSHAAAFRHANNQPVLRQRRLFLRNEDARGGSGTSTSCRCARPLRPSAQASAGVRA